MRPLNQVLIALFVGLVIGVIFHIIIKDDKKRRLGILVGCLIQLIIINSVPIELQRMPINIVWGFMYSLFISPNDIKLLKSKLTREKGNKT